MRFLVCTLAVLGLGLGLSSTASAQTDVFFGFGISTPRIVLAMGHRHEHARQGHVHRGPGMKKGRHLAWNKGYKHDRKYEKRAEVVVHGKEARQGRDGRNDRGSRNGGRR